MKARKGANQGYWSIVPSGKAWNPHRYAVLYIIHVIRTSNSGLEMGSKWGRKSKGPMPDYGDFGILSRF